MPDLPRFKPGDIVTWTGKSCGTHKRHVGKIVVVIPAGKDPDKYLGSHAGKYLDRPYRNNGFGKGRDRPSYIVVEHNRVFWPRVTALKAAKGVMDANQEGQ